MNANLSDYRFAFITSQRVENFSSLLTKTTSGRYGPLTNGMNRRMRAEYVVDGNVSGKSRRLVVPIRA